MAENKKGGEKRWKIFPHYGRGLLQLACLGIQPAEVHNKSTTRCRKENNALRFMTAQADALMPLFDEVSRRCGAGPG
ncbi:MAG TPA: hypothetical protein IAB01_00265 [Candidatus Avidesulfovibrio excrementigallinarum]|nr:hypothetical protein [Candidatus Avidesulfovibrio excrementigallinarum]